MNLFHSLRASAWLFASLALFAPLTRAADPTSFGFLRTTQIEKQSGLQTLSQEYRPASGVGPSIWLVGVAHIGTPEYYKALQARLDRQTVVLFEGVNGAAMKEGSAAAIHENGVQLKLAHALGLKFQLEEIDYRRPNFFNSDVTLGDLKQEIHRHQPGGAAAAKSPHEKRAPSVDDAQSPSSPADSDATTDDKTFNLLMQAMEGTGSMGKMIDGFVTTVNSSPQMRETIKIVLVEVLGSASGIIDQVKAGSPQMKSLLDVLITERNDSVVRDLQTRLPTLRPSDSIAVFYGAAHLDEIARRLVTEFHYTPAKQEWDTAFTADPEKSAIPPAQTRMLLNLMRGQMKEALDGASSLFPQLGK